MANNLFFHVDIASVVGVKNHKIWDLFLVVCSSYNVFWSLTARRFLFPFACSFFWPVISLHWSLLNQCEWFYYSKSDLAFLSFFILNWSLNHGYCSKTMVSLWFMIETLVRCSQTGSHMLIHLFSSVRHIYLLHSSLIWLRFFWVCALLN